MEHGQISLSYRGQNKGEESASEDERKHLERADIGRDCLARLGGAHGFIATAGEMVEHFSVHGGNGRRFLDNLCIRCLMIDARCSA